MSKKGSKDTGPQISPVEQARVSKAAKQVAAYANFLRWTSNFRKDEVLRHPNHDRIIMLSPMQSGRFSFAIEDDTLLIGVQPFEAAWMVAMPFEAAYVSDRLYLSVEGVACMDSRMPPLALGIFVDDPKKRKLMAEAKQIKAVRVSVENGIVVDVGEYCGNTVPVLSGDIVKSLFDAQQEKLRQQDVGRFF